MIWVTNLEIILKDKVVRLIKDSIIKMQFKQDCKLYEMSLENIKHKLLLYAILRSGLCTLQMTCTSFCCFVFMFLFGFFVCFETLMLDDL